MKIDDREKMIFDQEEMYAYIKKTAAEKGLDNTKAALDLAVKAHQGQYRKNADIPYICHPLTVASHALAMKIFNDEIIAACLLHDVAEDCGIAVDDLPVSSGTKKLVALLTKTAAYDGSEKAKKAYYQAIAADPEAALIKCLDRCDNVAAMSWGFDRKKRLEYIAETEEYILPLLERISEDPELDSAAWLLSYQLISTLNTYKRLMNRYLVFTYGTLMKGEVNHHYVRNGDYLGDAVLSDYILYDTGYAYPAAVPSPGGKVYGEVYEVDEETRDLMDELEDLGILYDRKEVEVEMNEKKIRAWFYEYLQNTAGMKRSDPDRKWTAAE